MSPFDEMAAYEALWTERGATYKTIGDKLRQAPQGAVPSDLVSRSTIASFKIRLKEIFACYSLVNIGICVHGANEYPEKLRNARHPIEAPTIKGNGISLIPDRS
jgi:hypothetical protein